MAKTTAFAAWARAFRMAVASERAGVPTREFLEQAQAAHSRRAFLQQMGGAAAGLAVVPALLGPGRAHARALKPSESAARVAVIGAGLGGLACADALIAAGLAGTTLFEATGGPGGRCLSKAGVFPGQVAEIGGELIDTQHSTMRSYARQFGLELEVMEDPSLEPRYYIDGQFYDEAEVVEEVRAFIPAMNRDLQSLTSPDPENATDADRALDYTTLADYLETRGAGHVARAVIDSSYTGEYGLEIAEQSALNLLLFMHADRRSKFTPFGQFSDEKYHVIGGNGQIAHGLAGRIGGGALRYGHSLVAARHRADGAVVLTFDTAGGAVEHVADAVIFAVPFTVLRRVDLSGLNLPAFKRRAIDELIYGTNAKVMVGTHGRPWQDAGFNGSSYVLMDTLLNTWETNPIQGGADRGILTSFTGGQRGLAACTGTLRDQAEAVIAEADILFPGVAAAARRGANGAPVALRGDWPVRPTQYGSYVCNHPGYFTTIKDHEGLQTGNLHWAGEHTDGFDNWQGFMEGACNSGLRAAAEVLADIKIGTYDD